MGLVGKVFRARPGRSNCFQELNHSITKLKNVTGAQKCLTLNTAKFTMSGVQSKISGMPRSRKIMRGKNQSAATDSERTQVLELIQKDMKRAIITELNMLEKLKVDMEDRKRRPKSNF